MQETLAEIEQLLSNRTPGDAKTARTQIAIAQGRTSDRQLLAMLKALSITAARQMGVQATKEEFDAIRKFVTRHGSLVAEVHMDCEGYLRVGDPQKVIEGVLGDLEMLNTRAAEKATQAERDKARALLTALYNDLTADLKTKSQE